MSLLALSSVMDFYPRPPRGGRRLTSEGFPRWWTFLSTPSARRATHTPREQHIDRIISIHALREEGDRSSRNRSQAPRHFYPRPPRGGRPRTRARQRSLSGRFLSTPSARRATQNQAQGVQRGQFLSTPSARRATLGEFLDKFPEEISIHALREEGDLAGGRDDRAAGKFLSTPSARRATEPVGFIDPDNKISIHALREEGDPARNPTNAGGEIFLSTPSARRATTSTAPSASSW